VEHRYNPATLGSCADRGDEVFMGCHECEHTLTLDLAPLIKHLGRDYPIPDLKKLGHCQRCGARNAYVRLASRSVLDKRG